MLPNYQGRSPFVLKHTTSYVSFAKRSQFQYFSINERGESCCTALATLFQPKSL